MSSQPSPLRRVIDYARRYLTQEQLELLADHDAPVEGAGGLRRYIAGQSVEAFAAIYFARELTEALAPIHQRLIADIDDIIVRQREKRRGVKNAYAIPRGASKTTWFARILPLYALLYGYSRLTLLIAANQTAANRLLRNIQSCYTNELRADFGEPVWSSERIEYEGRTIVGYGMGSGAIRGLSNPARPSLVIADDLDTDDSARSGAMTSANIEFFNKAIMSLGDNVNYTTSFVVVGTLIRKTSLLRHILDSADFTSVVEQGVKRFADNTELWREWERWYLAQAAAGKQPKDPDSDEFYQEHKAAMLAGTEVLWDRPDAYYTMMVYRLARGEKAFFSEIMNQPQDVAGKLGVMEFVNVADVVQVPHEWELLAALDPTAKGGKTNDLSAWVEVLYHPRSKQLVVVHCDAKQRGYSETITDIVRRVRQSSKRYDGVYCEANAIGAIVADELEAALRRNELPIYINRVHNKLPKLERIDILGDYIRRGQLRFASDIDPEMINEIDSFPYSDHDDAADALSLLVMQLREYGALDTVSLTDYMWSN